MLTVRRQGRGKGNPANGRETGKKDVAPHPKYSGSLPVNAKKVADLTKLLRFMPAEYHSFYEQLQPTAAHEDSDSELVDESE